MSAAAVFCGVIDTPTRKEIDYKIPIKSANYVLTAKTTDAINNGNYATIADIEAALSTSVNPYAIAVWKQ